MAQPITHKPVLNLSEVKVNLACSYLTTMHHFCLFWVFPTFEIEKMSDSEKNYKNRRSGKNVLRAFLIHKYLDHPMNYRVQLVS